MNDYWKVATIVLALALLSLVFFLYLAFAMIVGFVNSILYWVVSWIQLLLEIF